MAGVTTCFVGDKQILPSFTQISKASNRGIGPHCHQQFYWGTAEPVRATTKGTRQAAKSGEPVGPQRDPFSRPCEADAAATHAAAVAAARDQPIQHPNWDMNVAGFPLANFVDLVMG